MSSLRPLFRPADQSGQASQEARGGERGRQPPKISGRDLLRRDQVVHGPRGARASCRHCSEYGRPHLIVNFYKQPLKQ